MKQRWLYMRGFNYYHGLWHSDDGLLVDREVWAEAGLRKLRGDFKYVKIGVRR